MKTCLINVKIGLCPWAVKKTLASLFQLPQTEIEFSGKN